MAAVRLRQAVVVARELEPAASQLRAALGLGEPFRDPGVGEFGLANTVFAVGDCFLEVISPTRPGTAAGRYLDRHGGDCGYMVIFDLVDLDGARQRAEQLGVRVIWQIDLPDISGTHLHPRDVGGAIVSLDRSQPYGSWRGGGPDWPAKTATPGPGALAGITMAVADPAGAAARWGALLGVQASDGAQPTLALDGGEVRFIASSGEADEGLVELALELPGELPGGGDSQQLAGVRVRRIAQAAGGAG